MLPFRIVLNVSMHPLKRLPLVFSFQSRVWRWNFHLVFALVLWFWHHLYIHSVVSQWNFLYLFCYPAGCADEGLDFVTLILHKFGLVSIQLSWMPVNCSTWFQSLHWSCTVSHKMVFWQKQNISKATHILADYVKRRHVSLGVLHSSRTCQD